jgi:hypothetical protein
VTTIDLDELERLAKACMEVDGDAWYSRHSFFGIAPEADRRFIVGVSPSVILALIARLKRAERTWRDREPPHCATCDCEVPGAEKGNG